MTTGFHGSGMTSHAAARFWVVIFLISFDICELWPCVTGLARLIFPVGNGCGLSLIQSGFLRLLIVAKCTIRREIRVAQGRRRISLTLILGFWLLGSASGDQAHYQNYENVFHFEIHYPAFTGSPNLVSICTPILLRNAKGMIAPAKTKR